MQEESKFVKEAVFKITQEQIDKIRPYMKDLDELLKDHDRFEDELNDAIVYELGDDYEDTDASLMLQDVYDEVYEQNKK